MEPPREDRAHEARAREHLANERTLLAWIRTSIALMGLGFVVARFGLFLKQLALQVPGTPPQNGGPAAAIGAALVGAGVLATALSTYRFFRARTQIEHGRFEPEAFTELVMVAITLAGGLALLLYLVLAG
jgi:putative membrane protein